jgi:hypothetical protein
MTKFVYHEIKDTMVKDFVNLSFSEPSFHQSTKFVSQRLIHAGGIILYDDNGFWVIKEFHKDTFKYSDPGGKYNYCDCNIIATIVREFNEETYYAFPISYSDIYNLIPKNKIKFIYTCYNKLSNPTYLCIAVHLNDLNIKWDIKQFLKNRELALISNPDVPVKYYSSFDIQYIPFNKIFDFYDKFCYRLKQIVKKLEKFK